MKQYFLNFETITRASCRSLGGKYKYLCCSLLLCLALVYLTIYINMIGPVNPFIYVPGTFHMSADMISMFFINFLSNRLHRASFLWDIGLYILRWPNIHYLNISSLMTLIPTIYPPLYKLV